RSTHLHTKISYGLLVPRVVHPRVIEVRHHTVIGAWVSRKARFVIKQNFRSNIVVAPKTLAFFRKWPDNCFFPGFRSHLLLAKDVSNWPFQISQKNCRRLRRQKQVRISTEHFSAMQFSEKTSICNKYENFQTFLRPHE